jgi:hypothetical protein
MAKHNKTRLIAPNGTPVASAAHDPAVDLWDESARIAMECVGKKSYQLTTREKFAVCLVSGAHLRFDQEHDGAQPQLKTVHPCRVQDKATGGFVVTQLTPPPVTQEKTVAVQMPPETSE